MKKDKITAMWEEDGDLMRIKRFFTYIHQDHLLKERIKGKTLEKIAPVDDTEIGMDEPFKTYVGKDEKDENQKIDSHRKTQSKDQKTKWKRVKERLMKKNVLKTLSAAAVVVFAVYLGSTGLLTGGNSLFRFNSLKSADQAQDIGFTSNAKAPAGSPEIMSGIKDNPASERDEQKSIAPDAVMEQIQQKIIYVLEVSLKSDDVSAAVKAVEEKVRSLGGYVAESRQNSYENKTTAYLTLKLPVAQFENFKGNLPQFGTVADKHLFTDDVTNQYFDVQSRLRSWEAQEKRYLEILEQAKTVEDILRIEDSLANVRREMESLKGQLKFWDNRVQYSEIRMNIYPSQTSFNVNDPWQPVSIQSTFLAAKNAVVKSISMIWNGINYILVFIGYALPVAIIAFIAWLAYRGYRKRRK